MNPTQIKKAPKRSAGISGSLAYYTLLAGMPFTRVTHPVDQYMGRDGSGKQSGGQYTNDSSDQDSSTL